MPLFAVTVSESSKVTYFIEAADEEGARALAEEASSVAELRSLALEYESRYANWEVEDVEPSDSEVGS